MKPHFRKTRVFERQFPHKLDNNEWDVKLPVRGCEWKTYNPDYWCDALQCFVELATSKPNISACKKQWAQAIKKYGIRIFWWRGQEITKIVLANGYFGDLE